MELYVKDVTVHYTKNDWKILYSRKAEWMENIELLFRDYAQLNTFHYGTLEDNKKNRTTL